MQTLLQTALEIKFKVGRQDQHDKLLDEKFPFDPNFFSVSITGKL